MILNVIKEDEYANNNRKQTKVLAKEEKIEDKVQLKRIKELLREEELKYVSSNVRQLLGITRPDDPNCFNDPEGKVIRRAVQVGEKFRVILYIRLSQEDGDLEDGDVSGSIKNQLLFLLDECQKRNWVVVGIFCEEDISGVDDNRPEWLKSIRFAEVGNTEIVLCKSQSRFTRSMEMVEKYLHKCFPEWNVRFLGLVDNSDTDIVENKKSRQINGLVNEWFVEDTSKNTRATLNSMKRNGQFTGSFAPYGYFIDPNDKHHLIPDLHARESIRIMAGMLRQGKGLQTIIEVLMRKHYLTPADYKTSLGISVNRGPNRIKSIKYQIEEGETLKSIAYKFYVTVSEIKEINDLKTNKIKKGDILIIPHRQRWTSAMIRDIMTDETQIGTLVQGKTEKTSFKNKKIITKPKEEWIRVPHCHEANLDLETFNIVSSMFSPTKKNRSQKNGELPLFSKKVYCACCGKPFSKNNVRTKTKNKEYLQCKSKKKNDGHICDNRETVDLVKFEKYVLECIKDKINEYYDASKLNDESYLQNIYSNIDEKIKEHEKEKAKVELQIELKNSILVQLYADKVSGNLSLDEFNTIKVGNAAQIEKLKQQLLELNIKITNLALEKSKLVDKVQLFQQYKNITSLNRVVLDSFINKIEIGKSDSNNETRPIKIDWKLYAK